MKIYNYISVILVSIILVTSIDVFMNEVSARYVAEQQLDVVFVSTDSVEVSSNCLYEDGQEIIVTKLDDEHAIEIPIQLLSRNGDASGIFSYSSMHTSAGITVKLPEGEIEVKEDEVYQPTVVITASEDMAFAIRIEWKSTDESSSLWAVISYNPTAEVEENIEDVVQTEEVEETEFAAGIKVEDIEDLEPWGIEKVNTTSVLTEQTNSLNYKIINYDTNTNWKIYKYTDGTYVEVTSSELGRTIDSEGNVRILFHNQIQSGAYKIEVVQDSKSDSEVFYIANDNFIGGNK